MNLNDTRTIDPATGNVTVDFSAEDLEKAFFTVQPQTPEIKALWYSWSSPAWDHTPVSEQLNIMSQIAKLVEGATSLNLSASVPEPK